MGHISTKETKASKKVRERHTAAQENEERKVYAEDRTLPATFNAILPGFVVVSSRGKATHQRFNPPNISHVTTTIPNESPLSSLSDQSCPPGVNVKQWDHNKLFSDFIYDDLSVLGEVKTNIVMLFECPTSCASGTSFFNRQVYKIHDYPPSPAANYTVMEPLRYSMMNGNRYPSYLLHAAPEGLIEHWEATIPGFVEPTFVHEIHKDDTVYAYMPVERIRKHLNNPHLHYHLAGKDALRLMTTKTTQLFTNTQDVRPCIVKTTHSMGSKGIFVIRDDKDEAVFNRYLEEAGHPKFVITEYIEIARNLACHFFIHPDGSITWFGSNENRKMDNGNWSFDSTILMSQQDELREMQLPFVRDVVKYCASLGFSGFCGVDVLLDTNGEGYLVDVNPRVTGSCPAILLARLMQEKHGYDKCLFRSSSRYGFRGSAQELLDRVGSFNKENREHTTVVLNSFCEFSPLDTRVNIAVYSNNSLEEMEVVLNNFARIRQQ